MPITANCTTCSVNATTNLRRNGASLEVVSPQSTTGRTVCSVKRGINNFNNIVYTVRNTGIYVCQSLLLVHLIEYGGPYTVMFYNTKLYFDNQVSCLIRGWRFNQVSSLKYFLVVQLHRFIAPVQVHVQHCYLGAFCTLCPEGKSVLDLII